MDDLKDKTLEELERYHLELKILLLTKLIEQQEKDKYSQIEYLADGE